MLRLLVLSLVCSSGLCITNTADLIWYDAEDNPRIYRARQTLPDGLLDSRKIVVNQRLPLLMHLKFTSLTNLETLMIDGCGVQEIKANAFKDLHALTDLSLTFNEIKRIPNGVFTGVEVRNLNLSHNQIATIASAAFDNMPLLEKIVLDFNELRHWNADWFFNCTALNSISITHNFLEELPAGAFKNFQNSDGMSAYFSYNKIERIDPDAFQDAGSFGNLFLDWNDLERVDGYVFGKITRTDFLNLEGDSLRCLSEKFITDVLNVTEAVNIRGNPLKCECLKELLKREASVRARINFSQEQTVDC